MKNKLDILFINPPYEKLKGFAVSIIPINILQLATFIQNNGYDVLGYWI